MGRGQNAYGTVVALISGATLTDDAWGIELFVQAVSLIGGAGTRDGIIQLGIDPAGGTSPTTTYDIVVGPASVWNVTLGGVGVWIRLPLFVKAGSSITCAGSVNSATLTAFNVACQVRCRPSRPDQLRKGMYIDTFGANLAASNGTAYSSGSFSATGAEGSWVQIGSALTRSLFFLDFAVGISNAVITSEIYSFDIGIGDASNKRIVISNAFVGAANASGTTKPSTGAYCHAAIGDLLYVRGQASAAPSTGVSVSIFGVGG